MRKGLIGSALLLLTLTLALAEDKADLAAIWKIKDEGLNRSQVMDTLSYLTDIYGPRLAASPNYHRAADWAKSRFKEWGLDSVHTEDYEFGRSWELKKFAAHMIEPSYSPLIAFPKAWTPGTRGAIRADAIRVSINTESDVEKYRNKLKGMYVLTQPAREVEAHFAPLGHRYTAEELKEIEQAPEPGQAGRRRQNRPGAPSRELARKMSAFFVSEGVAALLEPARGDEGTMFVQSGGDRNPNASPVAPQVVVAVEQYNRMCRILDKNIKVTLEIEIQAEYLPQNSKDYNIIAELPGTDKKDEVVMLGGHFDSWHAGTGATDNGAGCAVAMEAIRILKAAGLKPRRTVRIALWGGEEEGLLGSKAYVEHHFGSVPSPPADLERDSVAYRTWLSQSAAKLKPEWGKLAGYWNFDNGTGKIRGIYLQGNEEVRSIFRAWLEPFNDMGATSLSIRGTSGTDHLSFDAIGLPGFQFIQDDVEYDTRTHHSNMDVWDRIQRGDMMQSAVIMSSLVYHTAMREEKLPRKPLAAQGPVARDQ